MNNNNINYKVHPDLVKYTWSITQKNVCWTLCYIKDRICLSWAMACIDQINVVWIKQMFVWTKYLFYPISQKRISFIQTNMFLNIYKINFFLLCSTENVYELIKSWKLQETRHSATVWLYSYIEKNRILWQKKYYVIEIYCEKQNFTFITNIKFIQNSLAQVYISISKWLSLLDKSLLWATICTRFIYSEWRNGWSNGGLG